jgi:hypothetical protein
MVMHVWLVRVRVDAVRHALQPVPGCVGMLHKPVQAVATQQPADSSCNIWPKQVAQYVTSMLSDINTRLDVFCRSE